MTEGKEFVRWLLLVFFLIFGVGKGIPAALILAVPEPLPKLAPATEQSILNGWTAHGAVAGWANELDIEYLAIKAFAMDTAGVHPMRRGTQAEYDAIYVQRVQSLNEWLY